MMTRALPAPCPPFRLYPDAHSPHNQGPRPWPPLYPRPTNSTAPFRPLSLHPEARRCGDRQRELAAWTHLNTVTFYGNKVKVAGLEPCCGVGVLLVWRTTGGLLDLEHHAGSRVLQEAREVILEHEWFIGGGKGRAGAASGTDVRFDVCLTTYEMVASASEVFRKESRCEPNLSGREKLTATHVWPRQLARTPDHGTSPAHLTTAARLLGLHA